VAFNLALGEGAGWEKAARPTFQLAIEGKVDRAAETSALLPECDRALTGTLHRTAFVADTNRADISVDAE